MIHLTVNDKDLIRTISPRDQMYEGDDDQYFLVGRLVLEFIDSSLHAAGKPAADVKRILDLPCGHGRDLRFLRAAFADAQITACDLDRDAVDFCASTFAATPVYSNEDPDQIRLERNAFDLIVVVSLLTHLDADLWTGFLKLFRDCLRPGGLLVFTTHGRYMYQQYVREGLADWWKPKVLTAYKRTGFGYTDFPDSGVSDQYGVSVSHPSWVLRQIAKLDQMRVVNFMEHGQDGFACVRQPDWPDSFWLPSAPPSRA
jgi:SAM-dependent methyltransferase